MTLLSQVKVTGADHEFLYQNRTVFFEYASILEKWIPSRKLIPTQFLKMMTVLNKIGNAKFASKFDLEGLLASSIDRKSKTISAFVTPDRLYQY